MRKIYDPKRGTVGEDKRRTREGRRPRGTRRRAGKGEAEKGRVGGLGGNSESQYLNREKEKTKWGVIRREEEVQGRRDGFKKPSKGEAGSRKKDKPGQRPQKTSPTLWRNQAEQQ